MKVVVCVAAILLLLAFLTSGSYQSPGNVLPSKETSLFHLRSRSLQVVGTSTSSELCDATCCAEQFPEAVAAATNCTTAAPVQQNEWIAAIPFAVQIIIIIILIGFSAIFSGLTLGLLSLDLTGLEIVIEGDDPVVAEYARRIYPVRKNGNLLLTTLLLGNVAVNSILSIVMADKTGGIVGFLASTFLIVIFGEILPQAFCSRHGLKIGSATIPLVRVIILLFLPVSYPLASALNCMLGKELATTYSNAEMLKLLQIHVHEKKIDVETANAMTGALKYKSILVKDVMTPAHNTFMLSVDEKLNFETIARIFQSGYSRIPVYEVTKVSALSLIDQQPST